MERLTKYLASGAADYNYPADCYSGVDCNDRVAKSVYRQTCVERLAAYEDTGLTPEVFQSYVVFLQDLIGSQKASEALDRFRQLVKADRDGRLVMPPCKVGDTLWITSNPWTGKLLKKPLDAYVNGMKMYSHGLYVNLLFDTRKINGTRDYEINHIGKTVFLTREEAEKALEEMKNG